MLKRAASVPARDQLAVRPAARLSDGRINTAVSPSCTLRSRVTTGTESVKSCWVLAPQVLMKVAVAVQVALTAKVCSRPVPPVPQPLQLHAPPEIGCGPRATCLPALTTAESVFVQLPSMEMYGVIAVGV